MAKIVILLEKSKYTIVYLLKWMAYLLMLLHKCIFLCTFVQQIIIHQVRT